MGEEWTASGHDRQDNGVSPVRILITGALGYLGQQLCWPLLERPEFDLHGTFRTMRPHHHWSRLALQQVDLSDEQAACRLIEHVKPAQVYHLAGNVRAGRKDHGDADAAYRDNLQATQNLYNACLRLSTKPRIVHAGSGAIYGQVDGVISEASPLAPLNPYGDSKAAADALGQQFFAMHQLPVIRARIFNFLGLGQTDETAIGRFVNGLLALERERPRPAVFRVGNLQAERDFLHVSDVVSALVLLMEKGVPGEAYNVASGTSHPMQWYLDRLLEHFPIPVAVEYDEKLGGRPEAVRLRVDISKLQGHTGWKPAVGLEQALASMMDFCRHSPIAERKPES